VASAIRNMLRNERHIGRVHWNVSEWRKDPDTGKRQRVMRHRSEWISRDDESLRIISHSQRERAQRRTHPKDDARLKADGRPKYLSSAGLAQRATGTRSGSWSSIPRSETGDNYLDTHRRYKTPPM
jgi:hypothetical protein